MLRMPLKQVSIIKHKHLKEHSFDAFSGMKASEEKDSESPEEEDQPSSSESPKEATPEKEKASTSQVNEEKKADESSSSDSDLDLEELMSAGPMKKKAKRG
jgi:hypothetical protein